MAQRTSNWNITSAFIYGRIPVLSSGGTRVSINGATNAVSSQLTPGFYQVYGVTTSNTTLGVWIKDGSTSSITASTKGFYVPKDQSKILEVVPGDNDYIATINKQGQHGSLCILRFEN